MKLLTTTQVRNIMRANGGEPRYTNKTTAHKGNIRRVKAYYYGNQTMLKALQKACGAENVTLTDGGDSYPAGFGYGYSGQPGVTVKCVLA